MTLPDVVRTGPLALAALVYWRAARCARIALDFGMAFEASDAAAVLLDVSDSGQPQIRERARLAAVDTLTALASLTVVPR